MNKSNKKVVLIGGGVMSATLAMLLKQLDPNIEIKIFEMLPTVADESSGAMNNAGTGHSGYCELNYTPQKKDKTIDVSKAIEIAHDFVLSKEFWAYCVEKKYIKDPQNFIKKTPHYSFVSSTKNVNFLHKRYLKLKQHTLFKNMEYTSDYETLTQWFPLIMKNRNPQEKIAATKMDEGTDVNFEILTKELLTSMMEKKEIELYLSHFVKDILVNENNQWILNIKDIKGKKEITEIADFVFIGAGGGSILLLEKTKIKEASKYGGFLLVDSG